MNFRRWVVFTFLMHVLVVGVDKGGGLILYLLTAERSDQHGESGIIASLPFILGAIANLGLATSLVYLIRRRRYTPQQCFETTLTVALGWGGLVAVVAALVTLYVLPLVDAEWVFDPWMVVPWCAVVPLLLVSSYANSIQLATDRVRDYNLLHLVTSVAFLPAFFAFYFWFGADVGRGDVPRAVAYGRLLSTAVVAMLALYLVRNVVRIRFGLHRGFLRDGLQYGWKANLTSTLTYLNHRIDLLVLAAVHVAPPGLVEDDALRAVKSQVAFYSMAVTWAELVWHFPDAMRDLFFSKVASSTHEQARELTPVLSRLGLCMSLLGGTIVLFAVDPIMGGITAVARGSSDVWYRGWSGDVGLALLVLAPGTVAYTVSKVLQADLAARDRLQTCVNAQLIVLGVMVGLDLLWVPQGGAVGAAGASTVAYVVSTAYTLLVYSWQTGTPMRQCLLPRREDWRYIREIFVAVWRKLRGGRR